jgi:hypothetical protein
MTQIAINDAGTWRAPYAVYVNDSGTWRSCKAVYVNDSGSWRTVFASNPISIGVTSVTRNDGGSLAQYQLNADGNIYTNPGGTLGVAGTWTSFAATAGNYESRMTIVSGAVSGGTIGSWENLSVTRTWSRNAVLGFSDSVQLTLEIRRASDGVVLDTKSITITCDRT